MHTETIKLIYSPVSLLNSLQTNEQQQQKDEPDTQKWNTTKIKQLNLLFSFLPMTNKDTT